MKSIYKHLMITDTNLHPLADYVDRWVKEEVVTRLGRVSSGQILFITVREFLGGTAVEYGGKYA